MTIKEAREQLKDLIRDRESFIVGDDDEIYRKDIEALKKALFGKIRMKASIVSGAVKH